MIGVVDCMRGLPMTRGNLIWEPTPGESTATAHSCQAQSHNTWVAKRNFQVKIGFLWKENTEHDDRAQKRRPPPEASIPVP